MRRLVIAVSVSSLLVAGCSDDDERTASSAPPLTATPTVCAPESNDVSTVTIDVDDDSDGFGRFGLRTPTGLAAGAVQLVVDAVEDNPNPVDVSVSSAGQVVFQFVQVEAGVRCAATVDLSAGEYVVAFGSSSKTFTVEG